MKKIFLSPETRPAPHGKYWGMDGVYEHDVCCEIAELVKPLAEYNGFEVEIAKPEWPMARRCTHANATGVNYYLCIHTNASGNGATEGTATGAECLYYNAPASIKANNLMYRELTSLYPSKRGCKNYSHFYENKYTNMVSCYPELAFHDNGKDAKWIVSHKQEIAVALCKGICGYFGVDYKEQHTEIETDDINSKIEALNEIVQEKEEKILSLSAIIKDYESKLDSIHQTSSIERTTL
ncbi:MAG: N-acetylmuramoyl-L-alanine amidase [Oscillospiraceae bacterium]